MATLSVTVDRSDLTLADLVISGDASSGLWIPEEGFVRPEKRWNRSTASSRWTHGDVQTGARLEHATLQFTVYARGTSAADLMAKRNEVEAAFFQWVYDLTVSEDGQAVTYTADCADVSWGEADSQMAGAFMARAVLTVPVHPVGA